jgi:hypothetical protein
MALQDRNTLRKYFQAGSMPTEGNFVDLIDSMNNILDDTPPSGTVTTSSATSGTATTPSPMSPEKLKSFVENLIDSRSKQPALLVTPENDGTEGLNHKDTSTGNSVMYMKKGGNVGIGTVAPQYKLHVAGTVAAPARAGTYQEQKGKPQAVLADGQWQKIITGLDGLNAFEVVASASGPKKSGNYALLHAIALSTYGDSKSSITQSTARYHGLFKNIELRWTGTTNNYNLEIRTGSNFGDGIQINCFITQLVCE